ncbi:MAG: hypothetical protein R3F59_20505 [Myxococcota bacterium]
MRWLGIAALVAGCSEYDVGSKPEVGLSTTVPETTPTTPPQTTPQTTPPPVVTCETFTLPALTWVGSASFTGPDDLVDGAGNVFWDPAADVSSWAPVAVPDRDIPVGADRAYVGTFTLAELPPHLTIDLQSDDGIWLWVNGAEIGHWGGNWQEEGCVNEHANCLVTTTVPQVDVTPWLVVGENRLAARVSNPVYDAWFELVLGCADTLPAAPLPRL